MFVVLCKTGSEKKWWPAKQCSTEAEAKKKAAELRKIDREYHHTGHWIYKIEELTEEDLLERYFNVA